MGLYYFKNNKKGALLLWSKNNADCIQSGAKVNSGNFQVVVRFWIGDFGGIFTGFYRFAGLRNSKLRSLVHWNRCLLNEKPSFVCQFSLAIFLKNRRWWTCRLFQRFPASKFYSIVNFRNSRPRSLTFVTKLLRDTDSHKSV